MKKIVVVENNEKVMKDMSLEDCIICYEPAIKKWASELYLMVKNYHNNIMDYDDFYSEGMITLMKLYSTYTPKNTFNTALHKSLDNSRIDFLRCMNAQKRKTKKVLVSFDAEQDSEGNYKLNETQGLLDENFNICEVDKDIENALHALTEEERLIFEFLLDKEYTKRALAKELKISRPTLDSRIEIVRDKVVKLMPEYFECQVA